MPKRPRQHQLEDQSRIKFQTILPTEWVLRPSNPDYGIDGLVEIFDKEGIATGLQFFVQLKATDLKDLKQALAITFPIETFQYYKSLNLPVLVARYHSPSDKYYVNWAHTFDPYYLKGGRKTLTFHLRAIDQWTEKTPEQLKNDVDAIRKFKSPHLPLPIPFEVTILASEVHGVPAAKIYSTFKRILAKIPSVLEMKYSEPQQSISQITVSNERTVVNLFGVTSFTLHTETNKYTKEECVKVFPADVLIGMAFALNSAGHSNIASKLISGFAQTSSLINQPEILFDLALCLARANRVQEALVLSENIFRRKGSSLSANVFTIPALYNAESLSPAENEFVLRFLERRVEHAANGKKKKLKAATHYNLANFVRKSEPKKALHHYRKAAEFDPLYLKRSYFLKELAGHFFENRRYRLSVHFYQRALDLGAAGEVHALHADAQMFSGKYREAQTKFEAFIATDPEADGEWKLKAIGLRFIRNRLRLDVQTRHPYLAENFLCSLPKKPTELTKSILFKVLKQDALNSFAWEKMGCMSLNKRRYKDAFEYFLIAALIRRADPHTWCIALIIANFLSERNPSFYGPLSRSIIEVAYNFNGESIVEEVMKVAESQGENFPLDEFLNHFNQITATLPKRKKPKFVRFLGRGSIYNEICMG